MPSSQAVRPAVGGSEMIVNEKRKKVKESQAGLTGPGPKKFLVYRPHARPRPAVRAYQH